MILHYFIIIGWERTWLLVVPYLLPIPPTPPPPFIFVPSLHAFYRGGMFLTMFCFPFPSSKLFQSQIIPSTCTLAASKCNLAPPSIHRSQRAFSRNPIFLVPPFPVHSCNLSGQGWQRDDWVSQLKQALYCRFQLWFTSSWWLLWKMGLWPSLGSYKAYWILTTFQKQKHPLPLPDLSSLLSSSLWYHRTPAVPQLLSFGDLKKCEQNWETSDNWMMQMTFSLQQAENLLKRLFCFSTFNFSTPGLLHRTVVESEDCTSLFK